MAPSWLLQLRLLIKWLLVTGFRDWSQDSESPKWDWQGLGELSQWFPVFPCQTFGNPTFPWCPDAEWTSGRSKSLHPRCFKAEHLTNLVTRSLCCWRLFSNRVLESTDWFAKKDIFLILRVDWIWLAWCFLEGTKCLWMVYRSPSRLRICNLPAKSVKLSCAILQHCKHLVSFRMLWEDPFICGWLRQAVWSNRSETSSCKKMQKRASHGYIWQAWVESLCTYNHIQIPFELLTSAINLLMQIWMWMSCYGGFWERVLRFRAVYQYACLNMSQLYCAAALFCCGIDICRSFRGVVCVCVAYLLNAALHAEYVSNNHNVYIYIYI